MSGTLWGGMLDPRVAAYTAGDDRIWDRRLVVWDVIGTIGHARGLAALGILDGEEQCRLQDTLVAALRDARSGALTVTDADEDVHSALEAYLVAALGPLGEKVHAGRSRNDQVAADLRLYTKWRLLEILGLTVEAAKVLAGFARRHRGVVWPGYTHMRRAMPSTVGLWAAGFAEALVDDLEPMLAALHLVDRSPLGSAAGFGVPLPLDRESVASALGFAGVQRSVTAVQGARGKLEATVLAALWAVGCDLGKLATDVILYSTEEFGFLHLPPSLATGSSIMPHKRNPDVFELTRARSAVLEGEVVSAMALAGKLSSGYHRDFQLLKPPLMRGLDTVADMLTMVAHAVPLLGVDRAACAASLRPELFATDEVFRRVSGGQPFRAAYREVAAEVRDGRYRCRVELDTMLAARSHTGGAGNLDLAGLNRDLRGWRLRVGRWRADFVRALEQLTGIEGGGVA